MSISTPVESFQTFYEVVDRYKQSLTDENTKSFIHAIKRDFTARGGFILDLMQGVVETVSNLVVGIFKAIGVAFTFFTEKGKQLKAEVKDHFDGVAQAAESTFKAIIGAVISPAVAIKLDTAIHSKKKSDDDDEADVKSTGSHNSVKFDDDDDDDEDESSSVGSVESDDVRSVTSEDERDDDVDAVEDDDFGSPASSKSTQTEDSEESKKATKPAEEEPVVEIVSDDDVNLEEAKTV